MTRLFAAIGIALALFGLSLGATPTPVAHAAIGDACPSGQDRDCRDPFLVCRNQRCISFENEPIEQIPVVDPITGQTIKPGTNLADFVRYVYLFGISFIGIAAVLAIFYGGLKYFLSAGGDAKAEAKDLLTSAFVGLALAFGAYLILNQINPNLVSFQRIEDVLRLDRRLLEPQFPTIQGPGRGREDARCANTPDCIAGLVCENNTCVQPRSQPRRSGPNEVCTDTPECQLGYVCVRGAIGTERRCSPSSERTKGISGDYCNEGGRTNPSILAECVPGVPRCYAECEAGLACEFGFISSTPGARPGTGRCNSPTL